MYFRMATHLDLPAYRVIVRARKPRVLVMKSMEFPVEDVLVQLATMDMAVVCCTATQKKKKKKRKKGRRNHGHMHTKV
jgi:hypothetical protein